MQPQELHHEYIDTKLIQVHIWTYSTRGKQTKSMRHRTRQLQWLTPVHAQSRMIELSVFILLHDARASRSNTSM